MEEELRENACWLDSPSAVGQLHTTPKENNMQQPDHPGYHDTDIWLRWLPEYEASSYAGQVTVCKKALTFWNRELHHARLAQDRVKTDIARKRWHERERWCNGNKNRWENTLRDCMADAGVLKHFRFEK